MCDRESPPRFYRLLRVFFGLHASRRTHLRLWGLRHETVPALRHRTQARVYRGIVEQLARLEQRRKRGKGGIVSFLVGSRRRLRGFRSGSAPAAAESPLPIQEERALRVDRTVPDGTLKQPMSQYGFSPSSWGVGDGAGRERGGRRKRVFEYLKAANELRQTYTSQLATQIGNARDYNDEYYDTPGAFPDVEIARSGDEEMVLFPSYARRIVGNRAANRLAHQRRDSTSTMDEYRQEVDELDQPGGIDWEEFEIENAIVTVDVRGWLYLPHRGPMTRKNRLMVALARKLSGVPAPSSYAPDNGDTGPGDKITSQGEEDFVNREMQSMISKAESEADTAWKNSARDGDRGAPTGSPRRATTAPPTEPTQLNKDELTMANAHLMERLRPFLANPMAEMPVTVFFFNDDQSQSRNILTDASGHFTLRAALPFVPTHIRVLASESLSAAKEIRIVEPTGVSLISDIDDTVKHSAIANGAKEMFRNTFVRELSELTVNGVNEWYTQMANLGVELHYVSNAPWQLYPLLERFFKMVGLPPGSFHLKQYTGMLQGIFEPTAERKRASLERIFQDFPERKFILVGDSGEADLEVYTDLVLANPRRILGIFIRDVTTTDHALFFQKSVDHLEAGPHRSRSTGQLFQQDPDAVSNRPTLPPRRPVPQPRSSLNEVKSIDNADLIDLGEEEHTKPATARPPPTKPSKPSTLRTKSDLPEIRGDISHIPSQEAVRRKPAPPVPPRRLAAPSADSSLQPRSSDQNLGRVQSVEATARSKQAPPPPPPRRTNTGTSSPTPASQPSNNDAPQSSQRQQFYPAAAATAAFQYASERLWPPNTANVLRNVPSNPASARTSSSSINEQEPGIPPAPLLNKREELWHRRWEQATKVLESKGVVLGSWRVGSDVQDVCIWLTKEALDDMRRNPAKR